MDGYRSDTQERHWRLLTSRPRTAGPAAVERSEKEAELLAANEKCREEIAAFRAENARLKVQLDQSLQWAQALEAERGSAAPGSAAAAPEKVPPQPLELRALALYRDLKSAPREGSFRENSLRVAQELGLDPQSILWGPREEWLLVPEERESEPGYLVLPNPFRSPSKVDRWNNLYPEMDPESLIDDYRIEKAAWLPEHRLGEFAFSFDDVMRNWGLFGLLLRKGQASR